MNDVVTRLTLNQDARARQPREPRQYRASIEDFTCPDSVYIVLFVVAGIRAHSLALLSEAGHNLSDFLALLLSLGAVYLQARPPSAPRPMDITGQGYWRRWSTQYRWYSFRFLFSTKRFKRLRIPEQVHAGTMIWVAAAGVVMNGVIALMLYRTGKDVNIRSALLHEVGDTLSTAAVIAGGWAILVTGQEWIDSALSFGIGALILWSAFGIVRETLNILLEGTPRGMRVEDIQSAICSVDGVNDVHDLHVWSIGSESHALSCHIAIADIPMSASNKILVDVKEKLHDEFHIIHTTIQFEHAECEVAHGCVMPVGDGHVH